MKYIIDTNEFGIIELDSELKTAYFYSYDYEYPIKEDDTFSNMYGLEFQILWPIGKWTHCIIMMKTWKEIGRSK